MRFGYTRVGDVTSPPGWDARYFANPDLSGTAEVTRQDADVDFDWGTGSPSTGVPADGFSVRWSRTDNLAAGVYTFRALADDGVRLFVDGVPVIDQWHDQPPTAYAVNRSLGEGTHVIVAEYYERGGGAIASVSYEKIADPPPPVAYSGEYFANATLSGAPVLTRSDAAIDFDWGLEAPASGLPPDGFSVRWSKTEHLDAGTYRITATTDDGVRVRLDGVLVIDGWTDHPPTTYTFDTALSEGDHSITVEYYDSGGGALARCTVVRL